jgi:hypothetical protein
VTETLSMARSSAIGPDDFARHCGSADGTEEGPTIGHLKYHPTVYRFMDACYVNGLVLSFDRGVCLKKRAET